MPIVTLNTPTIGLIFLLKEITSELGYLLHQKNTLSEAFPK